jgi:hypothetical protein
VALIQARPRLEEAVTIALFGGNGNFRVSAAGSGSKKPYPSPSAAELDALAGEGCSSGSKNP